MIYESLLATKKNCEIREIRVRLKRIILSVEHESFETKQLIRVIRAIRVPKKIRNSRAEKYLLLWGIVTTVACNEEICVNLWDLWDIRINSPFEWRQVQSDTAMGNKNIKSWNLIFSIKPGATFFLGSSRTLVYHKDDVEIIYKTKTPSGKTYYAHVYLMLGGENSVTLYADWGDYFLHLSSIKDQEHFFGIMKRPCPTFVQIWQSEHPDDIFIMSANAGQTMGLGMDIENVDYRNLAPTSLPFHPLVEIGLRKFLDANNDLYLELNSRCPLKLWKDRLVAVWGEETK